jgi:hypothetical protein
MTSENAGKLIIKDNSQHKTNHCCIAAFIEQHLKMALHQLVRCQFEPFLRSLPSVAVKSCTPQTEKKQTFFEVELAETILFPEGGGQPWDTGTELPFEQ